jgi:hypothetical protein
VRDPRATVRFSLDDRVTWEQDDGGIIPATIVAFVDDCMVQVRLENGRTVLWPTFSPRMRRAQTPDIDEDATMSSEEDMPLYRNPMEEAYYSAVSVTTEESLRDAQRRTVPDFLEYEETYPSGDDDGKP